MKRSRYILLALLMAMPAASLMPGWVAYGFCPDIFALLMLLAVFRASAEKALPLAWGVGLLKDLMSAGPLGEYSVMYLAVGFVLIKIRSVLSVRLAMVQALLAFLTVLLTESIYLLTLTSFRPLGSEFKLVLTSSIVTAILSPALLHWMEQGVKRPSGSAA